MFDGPLPVPTGAPSARVAAALRIYDRLYPVDYADADAIFRHRLRVHRLMAHLERLTAGELAHYYAGVRARLVEDYGALAPSV